MESIVVWIEITSVILKSKEARSASSIWNHAQILFETKIVRQQRLQTHFEITQCFCQYQYLFDIHLKKPECDLERKIDHKLNLPKGKYNFFGLLKKFTRAYLFQIVLEIMWLRNINNTLEKCRLLKAADHALTTWMTTEVCRRYCLRSSETWKGSKISGDLRISPYSGNVRKGSGDFQRSSKCIGWPPAVRFNFRYLRCKFALALQFSALLIKNVLLFIQSELSNFFQSVLIMNKLHCWEPSILQEQPVISKWVY